LVAVRPACRQKSASGKNRWNVEENRGSDAAKTFSLGLSLGKALTKEQSEGQGRIHKPTRSAFFGAATK
jgi:hypothetical protein